MLRSLRVNDFALIEDLVLGFGAGLNAVTGETGAGKSLLQRALAIAAGHRAGSEMVRAGCEAAR
ncbi:AAA family ATPase, partial [Candidatus Binatia bacterium]|nr:AAA family ATPase [Candidatus Binatia bacterium]